MYAVIKTGGKQYRVEPQMTLAVEKIKANEGETVELKEVLMLVNGEEIKIGKPYVEGAKVIARIVKHFRGPKIRGFFYRPKKHSARRFGHRQHLTQIKIEEILVS